MGLPRSSAGAFVFWPPGWFVVATLECLRATDLESLGLTRALATSLLSSSLSLGGLCPEHWARLGMISFLYLIYRNIRGTRELQQMSYV